ncbi:hypothetical protein IQ235_09475 [Oscillatoriales cyanobacterium LEGE 11467]|uniref:Uncharacterized protein n=1 Tax=Zarconia navalis LEGE 11467 TaxID=1828826 RepID=A0A928VWU2_9CYAN|nr:hypothetical protein [Zarconia navalis]MBE9041009.1 hypothetical protein [Zarconia navalis LEGE 11467]
MPTEPSGLTVLSCVEIEEMEKRQLLEVWFILSSESPPRGGDRYQVSRYTQD